VTNEELVLLGERYVMNTYARFPLALVRGENAMVYDADGNEYLDFVSGLAVNSLGHCHPRVVEAVREQAAKLIHCSNLYWIEPQVELARLLVENSCCDKVFFANSGAEANEGAIKLARKYAEVNGHPERFEIITMERSFHGRTLATLTATAQEKFHRHFQPLPPGFRYVPLNDLPALKAAITPQTAAIMLEVVQGEGGVYVADPGFLKAAREICDQQNILLICDEVQCGLGRTGKLFAFEHFGIEPDVVTLAKALAGGVPIGALLAKEKAAAAFEPGDHASTFGGNPLATAAGVAAFTAILNEGLAENALKVGGYFRKGLEELKNEFRSIRSVRGLGLLLGLELEAGALQVVAACQEKGVLINAISDQVLRFLPPLTIGTGEADRVLITLRSALSRLRKGEN